MGVIKSILYHTLIQDEFYDFFIISHLKDSSNHRLFKHDLEIIIIHLKLSDKFIID
jgi:hypothetical protein